MRRDGPHRALDSYDGEQISVISANIDTRLFERMTSAFRSRDGRIYSQNENSIAFSGNGDYVAYGLAIRSYFDGVAISDSDSLQSSFSAVILSVQYKKGGQWPPCFWLSKTLGFAVFERQWF